jgi:hypothetical protein
MTFPYYHWYFPTITHRKSGSSASRLKSVLNIYTLKSVLYIYTL